MKTGNVIASTIALLWGLGVLIHHFAGTPTSGSGAFEGGQLVGVLFGLVLGVAGARGLYKEIQRAQAS
jgi:hypothetical protein